MTQSADLLTRGRVITEWDQLKACVTVLEVPEVQGPEVPERDRVDEEDRLRAMENLEYLVENLDNANDLVKLNGIALVQRYLVHSNPKLRAMAAKIFSTCASNNEKFVKQVGSPFPPTLNTSHLSYTRLSLRVCCVVC